MRRMSFLSTALTTLLLLSGCGEGPAGPGRTGSLPKGTPVETAPVNIVFIMSDDHAVQAVSAYGHPVSQLAPTPNIDRIAAEGLVFESAFVTNSLCGPSRAANLTGKYGHINGFNRNGDAFDSSQWTWPRALKAAGYQTAMIGKWHLAGTPEPLEFDYWKIFNDQGEYYNPQIVTEAGEERYEGYASDLITEFSLDWLERRRDPDRPFVLLMHHKAPHRNWMPALRHTQQYENTEFPVPETYFDDYQGRQAAEAQELNIYRDMYEGHDLKMTEAVGSSQLRYDPWKDHFGRMTPEQRLAWDAAYRERNDAMNRADFDDKEMALWKYQRYLQDYLATISAVDESVGEILDYLDRAGLAENTLVIYTSDQGFYLGEHGWFDKRFMYEESLKTPLVMRLPDRIPAGASTQDMVMNIDFAPTFLELAGLETPADIQGQSMLDIMSGRSPEDWRQSIYYHYYEYPGFHAVKRQYGVRNDRYKLIHFYNDIDAWEFFDLEADPQEMNNLIDDPGYVDEIREMRAELQALRVQYEVPPDNN